ncbi:LysR family substrate-binding domain-containing protein [Kitasatospora terrestris]|uniref:LysR substrate-binding domain-containing protein n=1 Tax=Kitasatospora terrestris TaxID=258051 RepID=A0ABP9EKB3_9ACTN
MTSPISADLPAEFRLAYVPGVTPTKWVRIWSERLPDIPLTLVAADPGEAAGLLLSGGADAALLRLPVDRTALNAIPLYTETTVAVVPKDHVITAAEEITLADLADEVVLHPLDDTLGWDELPGEPAHQRPATTGDAVELVAAGIGVLVAPQSLARLHHRRDLTYRTVADAPESRIALSWPTGEDTPVLVEELIGIVRGRTVNSSRGVAGADRQQQAATKQPRKPQQPAKGKAAGNRSAAGAKRTGQGSTPRKGAASRPGKPRRRG